MCIKKTPCTFYQHELELPEFQNNLNHRSQTETACFQKAHAQLSNAKAHLYVPYGINYWYTLIYIYIYIYKRLVTTN